MFNKLSAILLISFCVHFSLFSGEGITQAQNYQRNSGLQWDWAIESLESFDFDQNDKVLDVGSGDGKITALIASQVPKGMVVGLDISNSMISHASQSFDFGNLLFIQSDAKHIPFIEQFDKVVSFCTLHWIVDQEMALQSIKGSLKPNGIMLLVVPGKKPYNLGIVLKQLAQSEKWSKDFPNFKEQRVYFTPQEYQTLLESVGLTILSVNPTETVTYYQNKDALLAWIKPLVTCIDHLSKNQQADFIEDIVDIFLTYEIPEADGRIGLRDQKVEIITQKIAK